MNNGTHHGTRARPRRHAGAALPAAKDSRQAEAKPAAQLAQIEHRDPAALLMEAERVPEPTHEELTFALGRLLAWLLDGKTLPRIGVRTLILAYKIRPDLIEGATLDRIAQRRGHGRSGVANLAREFTRTFGVRGINDRATPTASARYRAAWHRTHTDAKPNTRPSRHLWVLNTFCEWRASLAAINGLPATPEARQKMLREFEPIARFIEELKKGKAA